MSPLPCPRCGDLTAAERCACGAIVGKPDEAELHLGRPRYVVASVTGYAIHPGATRTTHTEQTSYTVLDRAYCHRIFESFEPGRGRTEDVCERRAHAVCDALNEGRYPPRWVRGEQRNGPPRGSWRARRAERLGL